MGVLLGWQVLSVRSSNGPVAFFTTPLEGGMFRTSIGERSTVTLSDGSSIVLDTDTRINVSYSSQARRVRLFSGQAWFHVARDASRPFTVEAGDQRVVAHGTVFDVRVEDRQRTVEVTLLEGRVSVEPIRWAFVDFVSPPAKTELAPGEELTAGPNRPINKQHADISRVSSWIKGQVVFNGDSLDSAIAELNRYTTSQIELSDPALASFKVSGVFYAGHSDSFLQTLTSYYPIRIIERTDNRVVLGRKPQ
jgi:transmembrane sensor